MTLPSIADARQSHFIESLLCNFNATLSLSRLGYNRSNYNINRCITVHTRHEIILFRYKRRLLLVNYTIGR